MRARYGNILALEKTENFIVSCTMESIYRCSFEIKYACTLQVYVCDDKGAFMKHD